MSCRPNGLSAACLPAFLSLLILNTAFAQWTQQVPILQASDEVNSAIFGSASAIGGNVAVVGAYQHTSGGVQRGQAYIERFNGSTWAEEQILQASDEVDVAQFGVSVAVSGNVVIVGANNHPSGGSSRGQAYVFRYNGATWVQEQILQASDEVNAANFGISVAISGNLALVGASGHASGGTSRGQAYIFRYNGAAWVEEQILQASDEVNNASFGFASALDGSLAVIGAFVHPSGGTQRGQAYAFRYNGATWVEEQIFQASDEINSARFGVSVGVSGAVAVVGAYLHPSGGSQRGQSYVYRYNGANWSEEKILQASDEVDSAWFGQGVSVSGPLIFVGAALHASGGTFRGQCYLFRDTGGTWPEEQMLQASDEVNNAAFGHSVGISGNEAIAGAYFHPSGGTDRGHAYIFFGPTPSPTPTETESPTPSETESPTPTETESATPTETETETPTETATASPTETDSPAPTGTESPSPSPTSGPNAAAGWSLYE